MATEPRTRQLSFKAFSGVDSFKNWNIATPGNLFHAENARCTKAGAIEKRDGTTRAASENGAEQAQTCAANYALFYHPNESTEAANARFKVSQYTDSNSVRRTDVYYDDPSVEWTSYGSTLASGSYQNARLLFELGDSTTQYDITNPGGTTFRYTYDGTGTDPMTAQKVFVGKTVQINGANFSSGNNGTFTITGTGSNYFEVTNASGVVESNKTLGSSGYINITPGDISTAVVEGVTLLVNNNISGRQINKDCAVVLDTSTSSFLYNAPKANLVNYYKGSIYLGDFRYGGSASVAPQRFQNHVTFSSPLVGLISLVELDYDAGSTELRVSDTKFIRTSDSLDVYRGGTLIETLTVSAKTENTITVSSTSNALKGADELWVAGTKVGSTTMGFRWNDATLRGTDLKRYDTFALTGGTNGALTMMTNIGDYMMIANEDNIGAWDNSALRIFDSGIGCVSKRGYVKANNILFFLDYKGIFITAGAEPKVISNPVERYIKGATRANLQAAAMGKKGFSVFCAIGDVTLYNEDGSVEKTVEDCCLEYEIRLDQWFVHSNVPASQFATFIYSGDADTPVFASTDATVRRSVMKFLPNEIATDDSSSTATNIPFRADSQEILIGGPNEAAEPISLVAYLDRGAAVKCFVSLDRGPFYELGGEFKKGWSTISVHGRDDEKSSPPRCSTIKVSLRQYDQQKVKLSSLVVNYRTDGVVLEDSASYAYGQS
jgi:hypothetical protein